MNQAKTLIFVDFLLFFPPFNKEGPATKKLQLVPLLNPPNLRIDCINEKDPATYVTESTLSSL